ncbi:MAG: hypothetical protein KDB63_22485, partial [Nocardioidaceae bacterium]|nr:hypothetical protein [Nocardioidaceae bacterium]
GAVIAVAAVAVAVPVGLSLGRGSGGRADSTPPVVASDSPLPGAAEGWRVETWRDLTLQVPDSWGHGSLDQWCVSADGRGPEGLAGVQRPEGFQTLVGCEPQIGYGVRFFDPGVAAPDVLGARAGEVTRFEPVDSVGALYPPGAWVGFTVTDHAGALVVAEDRAAARRVLDFAASVDVDPNNCWTSLDTTHRGEYLDADHLSICRYGGDGWLQQSELLSAEDTATALSEIGRGRVVDGSTGCAGTDDTQIVLGGQFVVTLTDQCRQGNRIALSGTLHELTERDLYWALSPGWSGGLDRSVPLPKQLRR